MTVSAGDKRQRHPLFGDQTVAMRAKIIHRAAGFEYLQRLPAIGATRLLTVILPAGGTVQPIAPRHQRLLADLTLRHASPAYLFFLIWLINRLRLRSCVGVRVLRRPAKGLAASLN